MSCAKGLMKPRRVLLALGLVAAFAALMPLAPLAQDGFMDVAPAPTGPPLTPLELGIKVYKSDFANCELCHGWSGGGGVPLMMDGMDMDGGPPLVGLKMTREAMIEVIACGRLNKGVMPGYFEDAWTAKYLCGGKTAAQVPAVERPPMFDPFLYMGEIEAVVTFIETVYMGPGMNLEYCMMYFGPESRGCDRFR